MRLVLCGRCNSGALWSHPERTGHRFMPDVSRIPLRRRTLALWLVVLSLFTFAAGEAQAQWNKEPKRHDPATRTLWAEPRDSKSRGLSYGLGGKKGQPAGAITFDKEDDRG